MSAMLSCIFIAILCCAAIDVQGSEMHEHHRIVSAAVAPFVFPQLYKCPATSINPDNEFKGQSQEDVWIYKNLVATLPESEQIAGTFVEIGAVDGLFLSNTWFFEKKLDWRGILIEGHPLNQVKLRENAPIHRKNAAAFTNAICHLKDGRPNTLNFTMTADAVGADVNQANKEFMNFRHKDEKGVVPSDCIPIQQIFEVTNMLDIDFFSLDVEGSEYAVLETIDFAVTNIQALLVELDGGDPERDQKIRELLEKHGFVNSAKTIGSVRQICLDVHPDGYGCTINEVFLNPNYHARKRPKQYYKFGTSTRC